MTDEVQNDAAPSSTEPVELPNAVGGASAAETSSPVASAPDVSPSDAVEVGNVAAAADGGAQAAGDAPVAGGEVGNDASSAVESSTAGPTSAPAASADAGESQTAASSPADATTFEERVEQRFLALESYLMKLPHSIAHAFSQGSAEPEELATRVLAHLFSK